MSNEDDDGCCGGGSASGMGSRVFSNFIVGKSRVLQVPLPYPLLALLVLCCSLICTSRKSRTITSRGRGRKKKSVWAYGVSGDGCANIKLAGISSNATTFRTKTTSSGATGIAGTVIGMSLGM